MSYEVRKLKYSIIPEIEADIKTHEAIIDGDADLFYEINTFSDDDHAEQFEGREAEEAYNAIQGIFGELEEAKNKLFQIQESCKHVWQYYDGATPDNFQPHYVCLLCLSIKPEIY